MTEKEKQQWIKSYWAEKDRPVLNALIETGRKLGMSRCFNLKKKAYE